MKEGAIDVSANTKKQLVEEFKTTKVTVQVSLDYVNNSELAKAIRQRAKEMLLIEAASINKD